MKIKKLLFILTATGLLFSGINKAGAQIALQYNDTTICPGETIQMCAALTGHADELNTDDNYTGVIPIGFPFTFFGKTYTKCVISGNGLISFDTALAGDFAGWMWSQISTSGDANNAIFATFLDLFLPAGGKIRYQHFGTPGHRRFIVEWCHIPVYGCNSLIVTSQAILYEGTNVIEIHTTHIPPITGSCPGASLGSYGQVVQGVRDETGTLEYYPPNRDHSNSPTNWGITGIDDDARRFTPNGQSTYIIDSIPFNPWIIIDSLSSADLKWYAPDQPNVPFTIGACATVTPDGSQHYYTVSFSGNAGCEQDTVFFIDTVHIHYGTAYDTTNVSICQGETYPFFGRHLYEAGQYDTLFSSAEGCDSFVTLNLTVNPLPDVTIKGSQNVEICEGAATVLALSNPETTSTYQWSKDGTPLSGETSSKITVDEAGSYSVTATTDKGCEATSKPFSLVVHPTPTATINPIDSQVICAYDTLTISAQPGTHYDYRWSPEKPFRQITGPEGQKVTGVFLEPTQIVLTVYNEFGCYDHDTALVATKPCCDVFMPNAFTPNNDGNNDYFQPHLQNGQILLDMKVFDRVGHIVYDNENPKNGWNGNYQNGQPAPAGTYMYYIQYTCADGKLYHKKESVTLLR